MTEASARTRQHEHRNGYAGVWQDLRRSIAGTYRRSSASHRSFVLVVFLIGIVLRLSRIGDPVTYNEAATWAAHAHRSMGDLLGELPLPHHHILLAALVKLSTALFGVHLWSLRLPALLAGILLLPLFYAFVRATFNQHIAVLALCLLATSGPFVEYGAMARGYALTWPLIMGALIAGRHYTKTGNTASLMLMAVCCALGMWAVPTMLHAMVMVYLWTFFMVAKSYQSTVVKRSLKLLGSAAIFVLLTLLCYAPVIAQHPFGELMNDPTTIDPTWKVFASAQEDGAYDLWAYITGTAPVLVCLLGAIAVGYAAYISTKYRLFLVALLLGTVPLVVLQMQVVSPPNWIFMLLVLHIGSAIGVYYLLKFVRDKFMPDLAKPRRILVASMVILVSFSWWTITGARIEVERFPDAPAIAHWFVKEFRPGDRIRAQFPWDAPLGFYLACAPADPNAMADDADASAHQFIVAAWADQQTPLTVWRSGDIRQADHASFKPVLELRYAQVFELQP